MSKNLVREWLQRFMFKDLGKDESLQKINKISNYLSDHDNFKSHGRHVSREKAEKIGLKIDYLEADPKLQDLVLSIFHSTTHTFTSTPAFKIIENHNGKAFIKIHNQ